MDVKVDDSISYIDTFEALKWAYIQKYDYISEEEQLDLMNMTYSFIDNTINEVLLKNKTQEKEDYIRKLCKFTIKIILPKINKKIYIKEILLCLIGVLEQLLLLEKKEI